jgi:hypothetical protein
MASKGSNKKQGTNGKGGSKPATPARESGAAESEKRSYKRAPALVRAGKLASQIERKRAALARMTGRWQNPDETPNQTDALNLLVDNLRDLEPLTKTIGAQIALLKDTGFEPKAGAPGRKALTAGDPVQIKEKFYDSVAHGPINRFVVTTTTDKNVFVQAPHSDTAPFPIDRSRVKLFSAEPDKSMGAGA